MRQKCFDWEFLEAICLLFLHFLSEWCLIMCVLRFDFWLKHISQKLHENGFSPVWVILWTFRWFFLVKVLSHLLQEKRSPVFSAIFLLAAFLASLDGCLWALILTPCSIVNKKSITKWCKHYQTYSQKWSQKHIKSAKFEWRLEFVIW